MSKWWDERTKIPLADLSFQKIIDFYLFNCPCEIEKGSKKKNTKSYTKVSKRSKTLRSQGWIGGHLNTLLASMKHTSSGRLEYHTFDSSADICTEVKKIEKDISLQDPYFEMIAIAERADMNKTSSIYYYIRNAFAHGTFSVISANGKNVYYFESAKNDTIKAQIRLREETLLKWIKDFAVSPKVLKQALIDERKQRKKSGKGAKAA